MGVILGLDEKWVIIFAIVKFEIIMAYMLIMCPIGWYFGAIGLILVSIDDNLGYHPLFVE